jgi:hypothetical protein
MSASISAIIPLPVEDADTPVHYLRNPRTASLISFHTKQTYYLSNGSSEDRGAEAKGSRQ